MKTEAPDYSTYTREALEQARRSIDATRFPERLQQIDARLAELGPAEPAPAVAPMPPALIAPALRWMLILGAIEFAAGFVQVHSQGGGANLRFTGLLYAAILYWGNYRGPSVLRWLSAMSLIYIPIGIYTNFIGWPIGATLAQLKLAPAAFLSGLLVQWLPVVMSVILFIELGKPAILEARARAGRKVRQMWIPIALGGVASAVVVVTMHRTLNGEEAQRALATVQQAHGAQYEYAVKHVAIHRGKDVRTVQVTVVAWNDNTIRAFPVSWSE